VAARARSMLFAPASRPDVAAKLPRSSPDCAVVDLEDAVPPAAKESARGDARGVAAELAADHPALSVYVRVNSIPTEWFAQDIATAVPSTIAGVVVPKIESAADVDTAHAALVAAGLGHLGIVAGIETTRGVLHADEILRPPLTLAYFGAEDYVTDLGGVRTELGLEVLYARSRVALAARVGGIPVLDQIVPAYDDDERFDRDAALGRSLGYGGKLCIHPRQVALAHRAFSPSDDEVERARRLLEHWERATAAGEAAISFDGQMVDEPMAARARAILAVAEAGS
jgi:citrate lyase subunit beta / citryl-CoA lyase